MPIAQFRPYERRIAQKQKARRRTAGLSFFPEGK